MEDYIDELLSIDTYYGNSQWLDRLTAFNGQTITYDAIGNPLSYYNGSSYTFTWNGRELATAVKGSTSVSYKYGADGLRTQKTVGSTVYNYYYADGRLVRQTWGSNYMDFLYDESDNAYSFVYNGTQYYYVRNLQGDVVKILNASDGVEQIGDCEFKDCTALRSVWISGSVKAIGFSAFEGCTALREISLPQELTYLDEEAFLQCPNLKTVFFRGTASQWHALCRGTQTKAGYHVICDDGEVG